MILLSHCASVPRETGIFFPHFAIAIAWQLSEVFVTQPSDLDGNLLARLAPDLSLLHFHQDFPCRVWCSRDWKSFSTGMEPKLTTVGVFCSICSLAAASCRHTKRVSQGHLVHDRDAHQDLHPFRNPLWCFPSSVCKIRHEHKIMPLWDGSSLKKYWKLCLKKGVRNIPSAICEVGGLTLKRSSADATAC